MSNVFLKRINKEIQNFYEKKHLQNNNYSPYLINLLDNLHVETIVSNHENGNKFFLVINNLKTDKLFLELLIPQSYPFKPYSVINYNNIFINTHYYHNKKYLSFNDYNKLSYSKYMNVIHCSIQNKDVDIYKFFYKNLYSLEPKFLNLPKNDCYCCSSITCEALWSPLITFYNLLFEHLEIQFIESYITNLRYKYLLNIYNQLLYGQLFSKLPSELIIKILN